jgi:VWFA-related protein
MKGASGVPAWSRILVGLIVCIGLPLAGQQRAESGQASQFPNSPELTLKTTVNRVLVDVTVTDAHGNPVHGLTQGDFTIEEDGTLQTVLSFDAHNFDKGMDYVPPKLPAMPANTFMNLPASPERGPLYVLFYDLVNIPQEDQVYARAQLVKFIESKPDGARFAIVVSSDGMHLVQGFTSDKSELLAAVDPNGTRPHVPEIFLMGGNSGQGSTFATSARLDDVARYLAPMPGRKNLIWFSSIFPLSMFPNPGQTVTFQARVKETINLLAKKQIAVYPVDTSGVVLYESFAPSGQAGPNGAGAPHKPPPASGFADHGYSLTAASYMAQDDIAKMTGGEAVYSSNDLTGALEKVTENGGSYYTISYSPTNRNFNGRLRRIHVGLKEEGDYQLSYRRGYYGLSTQDADVPAGDTLSASMKHGAPESHQLVFVVHVTPTGSPARGTTEQMQNLEKAQTGKVSTRPLNPIPLQLYAINYTIPEEQLRAERPTAPQFEMAAVVYDADGRLLNSITNRTIETDSPAGEQPASQKAFYKRGCQEKTPFLFR